MKIKNLRAGWVFIPDANLKLKTGQVAEVKTISPQTQSLIDKGYVAQIDTPKKSGTRRRAKRTVSEAESFETEGAEKLPPYPKELKGLHAPEAIAYVEEVTDPLILKAILKKDDRKTVKEAAQQRLQEITGK